MQPYIPHLHPLSAPLQAALSVVRALSHYSSAFAATFLYHTATLAWFGLTPTPLLASAPCQSNPRPSAPSLSPYAVFNSISRVTFHCMHRFIIAKMENSPAADGFPSAVASFSLSLLLPLYPLLWFFITLGYTLRALCIRRFELNTRGFMFMFVLNILQVFRLASVLLSPFLSHASFFHFPSPSSFFSPTSSMDYTSANCC